MFFTFIYLFIQDIAKKTAFELGLAIVVASSCLQCHFNELIGPYTSSRLAQNIATGNWLGAGLHAVVGPGYVYVRLSLYSQNDLIRYGAVIVALKLKK